MSTYRLQLHAGFTFADARGVLGYLAELGVSHVYLSPVTTAVAGSMHGYDVTDPTRVSDELGGIDGLRALAGDAHAHELGVVVDIVPNHLAASTDNPWWWETLRDGPGARHARVFDVDWSSGRVLLPVIDRPVEQCIADGRVRVERDGLLHVGGMTLPLRDGDVSGTVHDVLARQHYELVDWHEPRRNYRRFFDVDSLVGVRVEDPVVFEETHALVRSLLRDGVVDGLRVDHVDGLRDPLGYLRRLRALAGADTYVVVEKILTGDETLRDPWPVDGTTGYDAMTDLDDVLVEPDGWHELARGQPPFREVERGAKTLVLDELLQPELDRVVGGLGERERGPVAALTVALPVYRTYVDDEGPADEDLDVLTHTAERTGTSAAAALVERLTSGSARDVTMHWQQLCGPVMAKGHEDTALYRDAVLVSRNDVGGDPGRPPDGAVARLHARNAERARRWPRAMLATSTHDTKRSEDVRARIAVLSERAEDFERGLARLREHVDLSALTSVEQRLLAQTLLGVGFGREVRDRLHGYFEKALREAKQATSWLSPDEAHERAVYDAVDACLADGAGAFGDLVEQVATAGAHNSSVLALLKIAAPGVPDTYQGTELIDLSLVDPDNRRPVDYERRRALLRDPSSDAGKLVVTTRALHARRAHPSLFVGGEYVPVACDDVRVVAFARRAGDEWALAIASRFPTCGVADGPLVLPDRAPLEWHDALTDRAVVASDGVLDLGGVLAALPVALLLG
ncbi:MAG TPA: malto-oligosyltrehalose synthase [Acidimicrobiia bacterium]|nr:malto-oligosyltrehalose synthase [Acidimicrobiia bacterium]